MLKLTLSNVLANKIRLALTALSIVLGVGFVSSANILSDGLKDSFGSFVADNTDDSDLTIQPGPDAGDDVRVTKADLDALRALDGVADVVPELGSSVVEPLTATGEPLQVDLGLATGGVPFVGADDVPSGPGGEVDLVSGRFPRAPGEFVIDDRSAVANELLVGERYPLVIPVSPGRTEAALVGTYELGEEGSLFEKLTLVILDIGYLQEITGVDTYDGVSIVADDVTPIEELEVRVQEIMGTEFEVLDQTDLAERQTKQFNAIIGYFAWALRGFAIVALFVSTFIIVNTFNIVLSQRTRELGLLRAVGATPRQIRRAVLGEAGLVGLLSSIAGLVVGLGLAYGIEAIMKGFGLPLPSFSKSLSVTTITVALVVGILVTMVAAWFPARRAARISPVAAITGRDEQSGGFGRKRLIGGAVAVEVGWSAMGWALFRDIESIPRLFVTLGVGSALVFIGVTLLSPLVAGPLSRLLARPLSRVLGTPGHLAGENAARNPTRTASTASALMIGLALVSMAFVVGQTAKSAIANELETAVDADYLATSDGFGSLTPAMFDDVAASSHLAPVAGVSFDEALIIGPVDDDPSREKSSHEIATTDLDVLEELFNLDVTDGSIATMADDGIALHRKVADELGVSRGDTVPLLPAGPAGGDAGTHGVVAAIFESDGVFTGAILPPGLFAELSSASDLSVIVAQVAAGSTVVDAEAEVAALQSRYPDLSIQSAAAFRDAQGTEIDQFLMVLTALLGLAIVVAFLGIVNTMALSTFERTRELGLLRAVGMTRRQVGRMVRWEAAIVSCFGALLGAAVGIAFGIAIVRAVYDTNRELLDALTIPYVWIGALIAVATVVGLIAGALPARRAGKLDVLDAIAT